MVKLKVCAKGKLAKQCAYYVFGGCDSQPCTDYFFAMSKYMNTAKKSEEDIPKKGK